MARKPKIQARVGRDTKDAIDAYVDDHPDASEAEAIRELLRAGLGKKGYPVAVTDGGSPLERLAAPRTIGIATVLMFGTIGLWLLAIHLAGTGAASAGLAVFFLGTVLLTAAGFLILTATLAQLALAKPLHDLLPLTGRVKA